MFLSILISCDADRSSSLGCSDTFYVAGEVALASVEVSTCDLTTARSLGYLAGLPRLLAVSAILDFGFIVACAFPQPILFQSVF